MDTKLEALDAKIAKLKERKKKIAEDTINRLASCVNQISEQVDMGILIGMILDAPEIIHENQSKKEVWHITSEKFLHSSTSKTKLATSQNHPTHQPI